ncbi:Pentatricopeptide repeat-containing protein [Gracilariopsis chorda]|uniref:Pentatricopeptide repeat-containing protein n=1 Tax=Gracilariopsis chorda TaxID=448386 RepID=A0A2V3J5Z9_9FLOR|nr:Pentatricopeptide repeat-containing protein [Gracilariopsis chorda]|eukprot:PXF48810.1 Pentatricopeptide repeat-containing protein [Gracilariopsis chorda]
MRSSVGRFALRGATQLLSGGASRSTVVATRSAIASKALCTAPTIQSDATRRQDDIQLSASEKLPSVAAQQEPVIEIISEENVAAASPLSNEQPGEAVQPDPSASQHAVKEQQQIVDAPVTPKEFADRLGSLLRSGNPRTALWQYSNAMKMPGRSMINDIVIKIMLPILGRSGWAPSALDTLRLAIEREYNLGTGMYNCGLHAISRSADVMSVTDIISAMWKLEKDSHPNATTYNYLIGAYMYRGSVDGAFDVLNEMKKHLIYPTFATYHALIVGCLRRRDSQRAYSTLLAVERQRFDVSAMTIAQVMVASANNDDFDNVRHLLNKFETALPRYATEVHRMAEVRDVYRLNVQERTTKEEREVMRGSPKLEIGAISAVLHCAFRGGVPDIAMRAWALMEETYPDFEPPASFWYCMIGAFTGSGDFGAAMDVLGAMREKGVHSTLKDLEMALIRSLAGDISQIDEQYYRLVDRLEGKPPPKHSENENSEAGAREQEEDLAAESAVTGIEAAGSENIVTGERDTQPPSEVEVSAEDATEEDGDGKEATSSEVLGRDAHHLEMMRDKWRPTTVGLEELNCIIAACSTALDLERAFQTYDEVGSRFGLEKNEDTFNALLEGCIQSKHIQGGLAILEEMATNNFRMGGHTLHLACRLLVRGGQPDRVLERISTALDNGDTVLPSTYQMMVRHFLRGSDVKRARRVVELGRMGGYEEKTLTGRLEYEMVNLLHGRKRDARHQETAPAASELSNEEGRDSEVHDAVVDDKHQEHHEPAVAKH